MELTNKQYLINTLGACVCFLFILSGCSGSSVSTENDELKEDTISGIYFLHGTKITYRYDFPWPSWGGEEIILETDTTTLSTTIYIERIDQDRDTLQIIGLNGLNAGTHRVLPPDCISLADRCAYVPFTDDVIEFNFFEPGGNFTGTGILSDGKMSLNTKFEYRSIGIYYNLTGEKVND